MSVNDFAEPPSTVQATPHAGLDDLIAEPLALEVHGDAVAHAPLVLERGTYLVGKQSGCAVVLADPQVSRLHLELRVESQGIAVRDLGSKNGTAYRGARISEVLLGAGAIVTIGNTRLKLVRRESDTSLPPSTAIRFGRLVGSSLPMRRLYAVLERVAASDASVLIEGETGTGKELCAEAVWAASARHGKRFVVCDLAGVTRSLIESELFGHKKGAFTGAVNDHRGAFDDADGGTIFLDEIGELEVELQPRLLRALENGSIRPLGASQQHRIDVRVIAATNRDLAREADAGRFRQDLYHRLAVVKVRVPPLRERKEDIPLIVETLLADSGVRVTHEALELLAEHDWPGNVRELRNVIERSVALRKRGEVLDPSALGMDAGVLPAPPATTADQHGHDDYHVTKQKLLDRWEQRYLDRLLTATGGNMSEAARRCGLGRAHLYRLMHKHRMSPRG